MSAPSAALVQSVHARLVRYAHTQGLEPNLVFSRYAAERLLYRLSVSRHAESFVLKGAFLLLVWLSEMVRPTRDVDLLGVGDLSADRLAAVFADICAARVEPDGMVFDGDSVRIASIRDGDAYGGQRVTLRAWLGKARFKLQIDVGFGDAVTPQPEWVEYPALLDLPRPRLRAYRPETTIAEKVHAMVELGDKNSRMRDFFDLVTLANRESFDGRILARALRTTFERRGTPIPEPLPLALTPAFAALEGKRAQWRGFLRKNRLSGGAEDLEKVVNELARFLAPVLGAAHKAAELPATWRPGGPWTDDAS